MNDTVLYRRFTIVALTITALGMVAANVIQETRSRDNHFRQITSQPVERPCLTGPVCQLTSPLPGVVLQKLA